MEDDCWADRGKYDCQQGGVEDDHWVGRGEVNHQQERWTLTDCWEKGFKLAGFFISVEISFRS